MRIAFRWVAGVLACASPAVASHGAQAAVPLGPAHFGNPDQPWGRRRPVTPADRRIVAHYRALAAGSHTDFTNPSLLGREWLPQVDNLGVLESCREARNVQASSGGLKLLTLTPQSCNKRFSTGSVWSRSRYRFGFFEAVLKAADSPGFNNAFWMLTNDKFEIDIAEVHYPNDVRITLHNNNNWTPDPAMPWAST